MPIVADTVDGVIGVDTLTAAICTPLGRVTAQTTTSADTAGYHILLDLARTQVPGRRCWAVEGTGSYGAGLASFLCHQGEQVIEVGRPKRPALRGVGKSDPIDAVRAAKDALSLPRPILPRGRGHREALRVLLVTRHAAVAARKDTINQLKALIVSAPEELRARVRGHSTAGQITHCARLRHRPTTSLEHRMTVRALQVTARRIQALQAEADALHAELAALVAAVAPWLPELPGIGPVSAAQILVSWSYAGRLHSEAAFAALAGVSPIPASSGQVTRYRLNRGGDRQLNRALHTIALVRLRDDPATRAYAARRTAEGKSPREIRRCLKRSIARQLFKPLERCDQPGVEILAP
jgi:transposase